MWQRHIYWSRLQFCPQVLGVPVLPYSKIVRFLSFQLFSYSFGQFQSFFVPRVPLENYRQEPKKILYNFMHKFRKISGVSVSPQIQKYQIFIIFCHFHTFWANFDYFWSPRGKYFDKCGKNIFTSANCNFIHKLSKF